MKVIVAMLVLLLSSWLSGCSPKGPALSSAGTIGPGLTYTIPRDQRILVLAVLRDIKVDIISENIFTYQTLGTQIIPAASINSQLLKTMNSTLQNLNYYHLDSNTLSNHLSVLNTTDIQALTNHSYTALTVEAEQFLTQLVKGRHIDIIILLTQDGNRPLTFDLKCELSKHNFYYQASLQPHLHLYKIYIIDARSLQIISWITGGVNGNLSDTHLCKPLSQFTALDLNDLLFTVTNGLNIAVAADLTNVLTPIDPKAKKP